jgi:hypothetical protein
LNARYYSFCDYSHVKNNHRIDQYIQLAGLIQKQQSMQIQPTPSVSVKANQKYVTYSLKTMEKDGSNSNLTKHKNSGRIESFPLSPPLRIQSNQTPAELRKERSPGVFSSKERFSFNLNLNPNEKVLKNNPKRGMSFCEIRTNPKQKRTGNLLPPQNDYFSSLVEGLNKGVNAAARKNILSLIDKNTNIYS